MRSTIVACLLIIMSNATAWSSDRPVSHSTSIDQRDAKTKQCGFRSLYVLLKLEGGASPDRLVGRLPEPRPGGYSMLELRQAARSYGLSLDGVDMGKSSVQIDRPMIALVEVEGHAHYLVVRPVGASNRRVQILDPGKQPFLVDVEDLVKSEGWTGLALLPSRSTRSAQVAMFLFITCSGAGAASFIYKVCRAGAIARWSPGESTPVAPSVVRRE